VAIGWVIFLVSRTKHLQKTLANEKSVAEIAINTAGIMIIGIEGTGRIEQFNRLAEEKTGFSFTDVKGKMLSSSFV
jgi:PAS domain-containing protein